MQTKNYHNKSKFTKLQDAIKAWKEVGSKLPFANIKRRITQAQMQLAFHFLRSQLQQCLI